MNKFLILYVDDEREVLDSVVQDSTVLKSISLLKRPNRLRKRNP